MHPASVDRSRRSQAGGEAQMTRASQRKRYRRIANEPTAPAILLAIGMFVLVVDMSIMNVSISAVVQGRVTTVSRVQSAIALGH